MSSLVLETAPRQVRGKRWYKDPKPRFKPDTSGQSDGFSSLQLPAQHLAREVKRELEGIDVSAVAAKYSSQGRRGFHPRHMLGTLVYASLVGIHHSTKIARAMLSDVAFQFVAGGQTISAGRLREFRRENAAFFQDVLKQILKLASDRGLLDLSEVAVDSVRFRAHASAAEMGTLKRSTKRLEELAAVDLQALDEIESAKHDEKVQFHSDVKRLCLERNRTNVVMTSPSAGLMKFPSGAAAPGHRATVVGCGTRQRLIVDVFIDGDATDFGKLAPAIMKARATLEAAGVPLTSTMQVTADAGYFSTQDLVFAAKNRALVDILIAEGKSPRRKSETGEVTFGSDDFTRQGNGMVCPAGTHMSGPWKDGHRERWEGNGCRTCGLRNQCTKGDRRSLTVDSEFQDARDHMRQRFAQPGARARYNKRIATIEPIFSSIEDTMAFRRVSAQPKASVEAEILLKVVAYNLSRLLNARKLSCVRMMVDIE